MNMPQPSPGHHKLEVLAGSWEGEETMHPSQWDPPDGESWKVLFEASYQRT